MNNTKKVLAILAAIAVAVIVAASLTFVTLKDKFTGDTQPVAATETPIETPSPSQSSSALPSDPETSLTPVAGKFEDVEKLASELQPLLPEGARVTVDPKGKMQTVTVSVPEEVKDEDIALALERMEKVSVAAWQANGVKTIFGRRYKDDFVMLVEPFTDREAGNFPEVWNVAMAATPAVRDFTKVARTTQTAVFLLDEKERTPKDCTDYIKQVRGELKEDLLPDNYDFVYKIRHCGPNSINVIAKKHHMDAKLDAAADLMGEGTVLPNDTHVVVRMDSDIDVSNPTPLDDATLAKIQQAWPLGEVIHVKHQQ